MKKWFTLLGFGLLVAIVALCSLSVSAKAKPIKCEYGITNVSHGTFEFVILDNFEDLPERLSWNLFGIITTTYKEISIPELNDPYQERSQRWIKENNLTITGKLFDRDTGLEKLNIHQKRNC